jgi:hypothetical protein
MFKDLDLDDEKNYILGRKLIISVLKLSDVITALMNEDIDDDNGKQMSLDDKLNDSSVVKLFSTIVSEKIQEIYEWAASDDEDYEDDDLEGDVDYKESLEGVEYRDGDMTTCWHDNGQKESEGLLVDGVKCDDWTYWHENGEVSLEEFYSEDGELDGTSTFYYENGNVQTQGEYEDGLQQGVWIYWHEEGGIRGKELFEDGECIESEEY